MSKELVSHQSVLHACDHVLSHRLYAKYPILGAVGHKESDLLDGCRFDRAKPEPDGSHDAAAALARGGEARKLIAAHSGCREGP